jgi:hypothetical protein
MDFLKEKDKKIKVLFEERKNKKALQEIINTIETYNKLNTKNTNALIELLHNHYPNINSQYIDDCLNNSIFNFIERINTINEPRSLVHLKTKTAYDATVKYILTGVNQDFKGNAGAPISFISPSDVLSKYGRHLNFGLSQRDVVRLGLVDDRYLLTDDLVVIDRANDDDIDDVVRTTDFTDVSSYATNKDGDILFYVVGSSSSLEELVFLKGEFEKDKRKRGVVSYGEGVINKEVN